jgi:polyisoprenoid-binding protein YceI
MTPSSLRTRLTAAALLALASAGALAQQAIVPAKSEISFTSRQMGVPVDGKFGQWTAQLAFDPKKPEAGSVAFTIQTGSASFGAAETDAEVPKAAWFNVAKFPQASFKSSAIKLVGPGKLSVTGQLSIKGSSQTVVVPVTLSQAAGLTTATGAFAIKRLDFKIGEGEWADTSMVANDVTVKFKLAVTGVAPL